MGLCSFDIKAEASFALSHFLDPSVCRPALRSPVISGLGKETKQKGAFRSHNGDMER